MRLRLARFHAFARAHLPSPPARLLEIGCGDGDLAGLLMADGYGLVAIDPDAPHGGPFRRVTLEDFDEPGGFEGVVASLSLHHLPDVDSSVDKIARLLGSQGVVVLQEWAKEKLTGDTARWYHAQLRARGAGTHVVPEDFEEWRRGSEAALADVHPASEVLRALDRRFTAHVVERVPYLYDHGLADDVEPEERALVDAGTIAATGILYAGRLRSS